MSTTDTQVVLEREAWYKHGANTMSMYSGTGVLIITGAAGLLSSIFNLDAGSASIATALMCLVWIAASTGLVMLKAREVARRDQVQVERY